MTANPELDAFSPDVFLRQQEQKSLLRFITCGAVDDGKSTLLGRLLFAAKLLFEDQLAALEVDSRKHGAQDGDLDFALLLDGLAAEREQGITIDVAYRFFNTERRKFIVADTPGHEQYTRNMVTGASTAELAVILIDARKGVRRQTRRHSLILSMLGVRHVVVAVNKMDLVGWSESTFRSIEADYRAFAEGLDFDEIVCIPTVARDGDNVVKRSANIDWYRGPSLLEHLEAVDLETAAHGKPFRMPVQGVNRHASDFRGFAGLIASGEASPGMAVQILPSGQKSRIDRIVTFDRDLDQAVAGQAVILTLTDEIDVSRGDVIAGIAHGPEVADRIPTRVFWMGEQDLLPGRHYLFKLGTQSATATVEPSMHVLDLDTLESAPADRLANYEIGDCTIRLDRPIAFDRYAANRETGSFILIDRESYETIGMGLVVGEGRASAPKAHLVRAHTAAPVRRESPLSQTPVNF
jgi:sulfate adenylyltransferase large subunit